jgi:hypothetical protein
VLLDLLGGSDDEAPVIDDTSRIVLVAGAFRPEVTTTVLWLIDNFENMDIRCVRLQPFQIGERIIVSSEIMIPLPDAEQYRLGVQRKRREALETQKAKAKTGRLVPRLLKAHALAIGDTLYIRRTASRRTRPLPGQRTSRSTALRSPPPRGHGRCVGPTWTPARRSSFRRRCLPRGSSGASSSAMARSLAKGSTA